MNPTTNEGLGALEPFRHHQAEAPVTVTVLGDTEVRRSSPTCRITGGGMKDLQWSLHGFALIFLQGLMI